MRTATEDLIKQLKETRSSKKLILPLMEEFLEKPVDVKDKKDKQFLSDLIEARAVPRRGGIYSPSMLASCVRQVYFTKTKVKKVKTYRTASNAIFLDGDFRHFKWQFVIWKMHRAGLVELIDVGTACLGTEIFVLNNRGDYGGTIDQLIYVPKYDFVCTLDYKGMNSNSFIKSIYSGPGQRYISQSVGYGGLANFALKDKLPKKIEKVFIFGENKNGAIYNRMLKSPLGLQEWSFDLSAHRGDVAYRLKLLRSYERRGETPPPECVSTRRMMFKDCPFSPLCRGEVEAIERAKFGELQIKGKPKVQLNGRKSKK